jgi:hypothetical protein
VALDDDAWAAEADELADGRAEARGVRSWDRGAGPADAAAARESNDDAAPRGV